MEQNCSSNDAEKGEASNAEHDLKKPVQEVAHCEGRAVVRICWDFWWFGLFRIASLISAHNILGYGMTLWIVAMSNFVAHASFFFHMLWSIINGKGGAGCPASLLKSLHTGASLVPAFVDLQYTVYFVSTVFRLEFEVFIWPYVDSLPYFPYDELMSDIKVNSFLTGCRKSHNHDGKLTSDNHHSWHLWFHWVGCQNQTWGRPAGAFRQVTGWHWLSLTACFTPRAALARALTSVLIQCISGFTPSL